MKFRIAVTRILYVPITVMGILRKYTPYMSGQPTGKINTRCSLQPGASANRKGGHLGVWEELNFSASLNIYSDR